jgi:uncharacterized protein YaaQ
MEDGIAEMKLVAAVVQEYDRANLVKAIVEAGFRATVISSKGGFLRTGNATILSAVEPDDVSTLLEIIAAHCSERTQLIRPDVIGDYADWYPPHDVEVIVGGATGRMLRELDGALPDPDVLLLEVPVQEQVDTVPHALHGHDDTVRPLLTIEKMDVLAEEIEERQVVLHDEDALPLRKLAPTLDRASA